MLPYSNSGWGLERVYQRKTDAYVVAWFRRIPESKFTAFGKNVHLPDP